MTPPITTPVTAEIEYPDCDGQPMSDNTLQYQWIVTLQGNFDALYRDDPNVFVAGDLLWYPVEGDNTTRTAPDTMVAFGRPKGYRGSYRQWVEGGVAPQVVWEVLSPSNRRGELLAKLEFYRRFGVEEYYQYDPDRGRLCGWLQRGAELEPIQDVEQGWRSPRTGVQMRLQRGELVVTYPDGKPFLTFLDLVRQNEASEARAAAANARAEQAAARAEQASIRAEQEKRAREDATALAAVERRNRETAVALTEAERERRVAADARADAERREREAAAERAERLAARLRALGVDPDA